MTGGTTITMGIDAMADPRPFDWHYSPLNDHTVIDASYRNTQNVRRYFVSRLGQDFRLDRSFMAWLKANSGSTLGDAVQEWQRRMGDQ